MTVDQITSIITSVGFPIVCCGAMFWYLMQESKSHKEESEKLSDAINELRITLVQLVDKLTM